MASLTRDTGWKWPAELETFDPEMWGPVPGATLQACRCAYCAARWGAALPPDDSVSVKAARRRWSEARVEFLRETLGRDHPAYRLALFESLGVVSRSAG